mmetsp:Transcript_18516/g.20588  ORF Transcript_18516/g.20588 Transcript_18516/m.20588 type:complete len:104 (+) Transcript_18516:46-357(+)
MEVKYKFSLAGDKGVGKSCLSHSFAKSIFPKQYDPSIANRYTKNITVDGDLAVVEILDASSGEQYMAVHEMQWKSSQCVLFCFSMTDKNSFDKIPSLYSSVTR